MDKTVESGVREAVREAAVTLPNKSANGATIATETQGLIRDPLQRYVQIEDALRSLGRIDAALSRTVSPASEDAIHNAAVEACAAWHDGQAALHTNQIAVAVTDLDIVRAENRARTHQFCAKSLRGTLLRQEKETI